MRRSICSCEPSVALAGHVTTWKFSYSTALPLPKGTRIKFDLLSKGRPIDWEIPSTSLKNKENTIWMEVDAGKQIPMQPLSAGPQMAPAFECSLPHELNIGDTFSIYLGSPGQEPSTTPSSKGNRSQTFAQRRKTFHLYIDPKGKGDYKDPEIFTLDVKGNILDTMRITAPSLVTKNKRFDVSIRFEDKFGNLTGNAPEGTLIDVSYENLRENLNWKLFVPETGFLNIPNLYFNEAGFYRVQLKNLKTGQCYFSAPIRCCVDLEKSAFWGSLHSESEKFDALENIESALRYFRDERNMQFYATSSLESQEDTSSEAWKSINTHVTEFNEDFRFSVFLGMQWFNASEEEGLRQIVYAKDSKPILRKKDGKTNTLKKIYKSHSPKDLISIPCFTMGKGVETTFNDFDPDFEKVVEIYNAWGSSECSAKEGNLRPISCQGKEGICETDKGSIRKALDRNLRFGFVAGGLDDRGVYSSCFLSDQVQYSPGLTAILATEHTREAMFTALANRSCYATTGARIVVDFAIAGSGIGSELNTKTKPGLQYNRHLSGYVAGTTPIKEILIIRNGKPLHTLFPKTLHYEFTFDDTDPLSSIALNAPEPEKPPFTYYYLRILTEDGHIAWISPIWIDLLETGPSGPATKKLKKK